MLPRLASLPFRCYNDICSVWSSGQRSSRWLACIYMRGIHLLHYLHSFTLNTHTLWICFSLSLTQLYVYILSAGRHRKVYHATFALFSLPSVPGTSQETGQIWYQSPHLFWNLKVGAATRCENNVVIEGGELQAATAIADSGADSTQRSQSAYCLSDICFALYKLQMGLLCIWSSD